MCAARRCGGTVVRDVFTLLTMTAPGIREALSLSLSLLCDGWSVLAWLSVWWVGWRDECRIGKEGLDAGICCLHECMHVRVGVLYDR